MYKLELKPSRLLELVNELKKVGFTVTFEPSEKGFVISVKKTKPEEKKDFFYY